MLFSQKQKLNLVVNLLQKRFGIMPDTIIAAIAAVVGSIPPLLFSYLKDKRASSLEMITNRRIEWLELLRNEIAEYITLAQKCFYSGVLQRASATMDEGKEFLDTSSATVALGYKLILRLNPVENSNIIDVLKKINKSISGNEIKAEAKEFMEYLNLLAEKSHGVLKNEWEKVKEEAGYKKPAEVPLFSNDA
jgi:hypothetical protein